MTDDEIFVAVRERVRAGRPCDGDWHLDHEPATPEAVAAAEALIGHPFPPLLRRLYLEVADGGFGPSCGVNGVGENGHGCVGSMLGDYVDWRDTPADPGDPPWTPGVVILGDSGYAVWAVLDCRSPEGRLSFLDGREIFAADLTLSGWLTRWLSGTLDPHALVGS
ncbi:SMI1/KNR4 family protein [Paractinoplanes lichenicola]|uniref:SMI1/KNR4 family protein n=1 Tax=Paractinoplanes lichenicola TaxID=2802976 RepID=A0ABS1VXT0_9ACTN|nr:SMI1/KNR4 family protein [Actinoplanes lichenicola]MBL7259297.1 SMI1/KNR4 family protein [Actinoplanes lichenicola]